MKMTMRRGRKSALKKGISIILAVVMLMSMSISVFAANTKIDETEYSQYVRLSRQGILSADITFEYWQQLRKNSYDLEKALEDSDEFTLVYDSTSSISTYSAYSLKKGDVFITSGTSSAGILGHSGIAISSSYILHIAGPGYHPTTITLSRWNSTYTTEGWTKVYRHANSTVANDAGQWASDTYRGLSAEYVISMDLTSTDETYCSKLVWQAYYYGPAKACANGPTWGVRLPYDLPTTIHDLSLEKSYEET